jgi:hypothetical protein
MGETGIVWSNTFAMDAKERREFPPAPEHLICRRRLPRGRSHIPSAVGEYTRRKRAEFG